MNLNLNLDRQSLSLFGTGVDSGSILRPVLRVSRGGLYIQVHTTLHIIGTYHFRQNLGALFRGYNLLETPRIFSSHPLGLSTPSALSINYRKGIFCKDDPLGFMSTALNYDHWVTNFSGLCYDPIAMNRVTNRISFHSVISSLPSFLRSSMISHTSS